MADRSKSDFKGCGSSGDIICLEGNGSRPSHHGDGYSTKGIMYTLNIVEIHSVCYDITKVKKK